MVKSPFPLMMKTITVLTLGLTLLFFLCYQRYHWSWCLTAAISAGVTAYHFGMRLLVGWLVPAITGYRFDYRNSWFQPRAWEHRLYNTLHLRRWKKYIPTYVPSLYDLRKNSLEQVICNTCGAEVVHELIMLLSFLPMGLVPRFGELGVFLVTSILSALIDSIFVLAQRYNRPRLIRVYEKQEVTFL